MRVEDEGLVVDHRPYAERHLLLEVVGRRHGLVRGVLRRARGGKNPAAGAAQVLSVVRVGGRWATSAELATLFELESVEPSIELAPDLGRTAAAAAVAELLRTFAVPGEPAERPFRLGRSALRALLAGSPPAVVVAYCQLWSLVLAGLQPADPASDPDGPSGVGDLRFLAACRALPLAELRVPLPPSTAAWLDRRVRVEADRPLPALSFLRRHAGEDC